MSLSREKAGWMSKRVGLGCLERVRWRDIVPSSSEGIVMETLYEM